MTKDTSPENSSTAKTPQEVMKILSKPFPASEIKEREGGRGKMLKYVSGSSVIKRLIEATDGNYTTELMWHEIIKIEAYRKGKVTEVPAMLALVRLTIPDLGSKEGFGIQVLEGGEDMYKGAFTDGLKKAATQFGCALDLYETEEAATEPIPAPTLGLLDEELKSLLKAKGIDTQGKLSKALMEEFNTVTITPTHVSQWKEKLRGEPVAF